MMMSLGLVKYNDCSALESLMEAFPNRETEAEGTSEDLSLHSSDSLALCL